MKNLNRNVNLKKIRNLDKINDFLILENCKLKRELNRRIKYSEMIAGQNIDLTLEKDKSINKIENLEKLNSDFIHKLNEEVCKSNKLCTQIEELREENLKIHIENDKDIELVRKYKIAKDEEIKGLKRTINLYRVFMVIVFILNLIQIVKYVKNN